MNMRSERFEAVLTKIKDNAFDIRGYFNVLFKRIVMPKIKAHQKVWVANQLLDETSLPKLLQNSYLGKDYVIFFYTHKPHSPLVSPFYPKESPAHTSVLLCKVKHNKIKHVLNIDGYHFTDYVDILGERKGITPNPYIQQRLVIQAQGDHLAMRQPLQSPSWRNMNCVFYAFAFVDRILDLFSTQPQLMDALLNLSPSGKISFDALTQLETIILEGMIGKYVKKEGGLYVSDHHLRDQYHARSRYVLANDYYDMKQYTAARHLHAPVSYPLLIKIGGILSILLGLTSFIVVAMALSTVVALPPVMNGIILAVGVASSLLGLGLFQINLRQNMHNTENQASKANASEPTREKISLSLRTK